MRDAQTILDREKKKKGTHGLDELFAIFANDAFGESDLAETDVLVHLLGVFCIEGTPTAAHFEQKDAQRPKVDDLGIALFIEKNLWSEVFGGAAESGGEFIGAEIWFGEAKVTEGNMACGIE